MLFYGFRTFCQTIFLMRYPDGLTWSYPGFPSVVVPYVNSSDFFFSGHLGILTFLLLENRESKDTLMTWVSVVSIAFEFWMMVVLRAHYTIDLISGIVFAHYIWIISKKPGLWLDQRIGYTSHTAARNKKIL